jgi:adenylate cyclase
MQGGHDKADRIAALDHARTASAVAVDDATALATSACVLLHIGRDGPAALNCIERALALNASSATALYFGAQIHAFSGNVETGDEYARRALRLSPFDPFAHEAHVALAVGCILREQFSEAAGHLARAVQTNPDFVTT